MIKITDRQTGKELTLEECAREHGLFNKPAVYEIRLMEQGEFITALELLTLDEYSRHFNFLRFKLEVTND